MQEYLFRLPLSYFKNPGYVYDSICWIIALDNYKADFPYRICVDSQSDPENSTAVSMLVPEKKREFYIYVQEYAYTFISF